ncbi:hypothetical protein K1719_014223 [Acacia pycnantha]|nr:hypothetical protein K1719_014223 [Acacia pycnantha]
MFFFFLMRLPFFSVHLHRVFHIQGLVFSHRAMNPRVLSDLDSATSLLNIYPPSIAVLLGLVAIECQALNTSPSKQHPAVIMLFLIAMTVHVMALLVLSFRSNRQMDLIIMVWVGHISGSVVCELLLLLLVAPIWCFFITLSSLVLVLTPLFSYNYLFQPSHPDTQTAEGQAIEMPDLEAPPITSTA